MIARVRKFLRAQTGASVVEFTLISPLLFVLTFGIAEFGYFFYQYQALETATRMATRMAATRGPAITGLPDCGVATAATAGTPCDQVAGSTTWAPVTCSGAAPGGQCDATVMTRIVQEMQLVYPQITMQNLNITYSPSGLGFVGMGRPVPIVSVTLSGLNANFIVMGAFGFNNIPLPPFTTSLPGEDLSGA